MSLLSFFQTTEADVVKVFVALQKEEAVIASKLKSAIAWIAGNSATIQADLTKVEGIVAALGLTANPAVAASVAAANVAATQFIQFAQAYEAGQTTAQTVTSGYQAYTQVKAAVANALVAATSK